MNKQIYQHNEENGCDEKDKDIPEEAMLAKKNLSMKTHSHFMTLKAHTVKNKLEAFTPQLSLVSEFQYIPQSRVFQYTI